jgi:AraC family transcriptional activator of pobA
MEAGGIPIPDFPTNIPEFTRSSFLLMAEMVFLVKPFVMSDIAKLDTVAQYNAMRGMKTLHPLVTVLDLSKAKPMPACMCNFGLYAVFLKELKCGELKYGRSHYDYQEGTLVFIAPGQVVGIPPRTRSFKAKGWALLFHPDLIKGTSLGRRIQEFSFFSYDVNEALHVSDKERQIVVDCFTKIAYELEQSIDKHSKTLIASNIELFLNYCIRFYDRQFITRENPNKGVIEKFESLLNSCFAADRIPEEIPTVAWCAREMNLSPNYFGDLVKKETGVSAQEYIQNKIIDLAKERVLHLDQSISEVAYGLGFRYPQHFTRLFKQKVGISPNEYRSMN